MKHRYYVPLLGTILLTTCATAQQPASEITVATKAIEIPQMREQHERIRAAVAEGLAAARVESAEAQVELAKELALHAQTEEEVLYPAALLVGDRIARGGRGDSA